MPALPEKKTDLPFSTNSSILRCSSDNFALSGLYNFEFTAAATTTVVFGVDVDVGVGVDVDVGVDVVFGVGVGVVFCVGVGVTEK